MFHVWHINQGGRLVNQENLALESFAIIGSNLGPDVSCNASARFDNSKSEVRVGREVVKPPQWLSHGEKKKKVKQSNESLKRPKKLRYGGGANIYV